MAEWVEHRGWSGSRSRSSTSRNQTSKFSLKTGKSQASTSQSIDDHQWRDDTGWGKTFQHDQKGSFPSQDNSSHIQSLPEQFWDNCRIRTYMGPRRDWMCSICNALNFQRETVCKQCSTLKATICFYEDSKPSEDYSSPKIQNWKAPTILNKDGIEIVNWDAVNTNCDRLEAERWAHLPAIMKNTYSEDPEVKNMTQEEVDSFRKKSFNIEVYHNNSSCKEPIPNPVKTFKQAFKHYPGILYELEKEGYEHPTPIQSQAWPVLMQGYDMIGIAQTGTGKTLGFILPALAHLLSQPTPRWKRKGPTCLVVAPTRELAQQIEREISKFCGDVRCVCVYGQGDRRAQIRKINAMAEIVVATPGRLNDFSQKGIINLSSVSYLVLDEADCMLDMGFEPQIRKIVLDIRPDRQTVMTSATWPEEVHHLAEKLLKDPVHVIVGTLELRATHTVTQHVIVCRAAEKKSMLVKFIKRLGKDDKAIVFVATKNTVDYLSVDMLEQGLNVQSMHGGREQEDREAALYDLRTGRTNVLLATDIAARGIDVTDVTHILNYDCPQDLEEYVHRVGRTGRAGRKGIAFTYVTRRDFKMSSKLVDILEKAGQAVSPALQSWSKELEQQQLNRGSRWRRNWQ